MVLCVLPYPGITVVDKDSCNILIGKAWKHNKPLGEEVCLEAIAGPNMRQIHHNLIRLSIVGFEGEQDMVYEEVSIDLSSLEPKGQRRADKIMGQLN